MPVYMLSTPTSGPENDPRGPIPHQVQQATVSPGHVDVKDFRFDPGTIPRFNGSAKWIWLKTQGKPTSHSVAALFRREFNLPDAPRSAQVWFSADAHARIYVNGLLAARGPDDGGQDYPGVQTGKWYVNYRDLTSFFHKGANVVAAEVFNADAMEGRYNTTGSGGLLFKASLLMPGGRKTTLESDESWRGIEGREWRFAKWGGGGNALQFDASAEFPRWRSSGFDDTSWEPCVLASSTWPPLVDSEIPARSEVIYPWKEIQRPLGGASVQGPEVSFASDGSCAVRFDRVLSAFIGLKIRGKAGTLLSIQPNEPNSPGYHRVANVLLRDGEQTVELPFYDSFSVINLVASNLTGPLQILDVRANFVAQPVSYRGSFSCSDPQLNHIWEASRWLTQICQQTHHLDSPHHQEPICDPGDYLIISLNNYCAFGQPYLARQDLRKYAWLLRATHFRPFHTSYALLWLQMLMAYRQYTGDGALLKELAPEVFELLDQFSTYRGKNGLLSEAPDYMFMDWVTIGGFPTHHPPAVIGQGYMTAFYYKALEDGISVARLCSNDSRVERFERMRREIRAAYNRELWDGKEGLYRDGKPFATSVKPSDWLPGDKDIETHSTQNNALAVLYDLAPEERQKPLLRRLLGGELNTQPYFMHFVFGALSHGGLFNEFATREMRRWQIEADTQSFREMWGTGDYSHAWECTPLFQMSSHVLGITPSSPGFKTISIRPELCDLTWAKGVFPTPLGNVEVDWNRSDTEFRLSAKVPQGATATVEMPLLREQSSLEVDGRRVAPDKGKILLQSGPHDLVSTLGPKRQVVQKSNQG